MKKDFVKKAKKNEAIQIRVADEVVMLKCGFIGGVEAHKDNDQIGAFLGNPEDELNMYYSLEAILRSAIKAKQAVGEDEDDIRAFLAVCFKKAIDKGFKIEH